MRPRIEPRLLNCLSRRCRYSTTASPYRYHPKVHAYKFRFSEQEALKSLPSSLPLLAVLLSDSKHDLSTTLSLLGQTLRQFMNDLTSLFGETAIEDMSLVRLEPMYVPTWRLDAEVEGTIVVGQQTRKASVAIIDAFMPGHGLPQLAKLSLNWDRDQTEDYIPVPFTPSLLSQEGVTDRIFPIPYTIAPFALLSTPLKAIQDAGRFDPDIELAPRTIQISTLSATPILQPVYLAKWLVRGEIVVGLMDASSSHPTSFSVLQPPMYRNEPWIRDTSLIWCEGMPASLVASTQNGSSQHTLSILPHLVSAPLYASIVASIEHHLPEAIQAWTQDVDWEGLEDSAPVDDNMWNDTRIVPWDLEVVSKRLEYLKLSHQLRLEEDMQNNISTRALPKLRDAADEDGVQLAEQDLSIVRQKAEVTRRQRDALREKLGLRGLDTTDQSQEAARNG